MSRTILDNFLAEPELNQKITSETINQLEQYCAYFETKNEHPLALNTATLGVYPIYFLNIDKDILFGVLEVSESTVKKVIKKITYIDPNWKVTSDPYNQLLVWTAHRIIIDTELSELEKDRGLLSLFKMLHYKFFTSIVNNSFKHGANKAVMDATIRKLSNKFDVIVYGSWKKVIEVRSRDVYSSESIHIGPLTKYDDDKAILYILSDIQSRIRHKIRLVTIEYYNNKDIGDTIGTYDNVSTDNDGQKTITSAANVYDLMIAGLLAQIQSPARFIDNELVHILCKQFTYVKEDAFRRILIMFTQMASLQASSSELDKIGETEGGETIYIGANILIREFIQKTYRYCLLSKVNMENKSDILIKCKNLYASSRVTNDDILIIKRSITAFVLQCGESKRPATNASIAICFLLYVLIRTFSYL